LAEAHSQKDLEKAVRSKVPLPLVRDHLQILSETEVKLQATLTAEVSEKLARVLELISEKIEFRKASINEAIDEMCEQYLEKQDPVRRAERALRKRAKARGALGKVQEVRGEAPEKVQEAPVEVPGKMSAKARLGGPGSRSSHQKVNLNSAKDELQNRRRESLDRRGYLFQQPAGTM
jgi:hypothetical protein